MAPSAGLVSMLAVYATPSFLLEAAGQYLESLDAEISECELVIKEGINDDERKNSEKGKISSNGHDDGDGTNKKLDGRLQQQTTRKRLEFGKENEDELARLHKKRDVMVQDIQWLQALRARTPSPSPPTSSQTLSSSTSTPTRQPPSLSSNSTPTPLSSSSFSSRSTIEPENRNSNIHIISSNTATTTHQQARRTSKGSAWSRRSNFRGRDRVRRPSNGGDESTKVIGDPSVWGGRPVGEEVVAAEGEEEEEKRISEVAVWDSEVKGAVRRELEVEGKKNVCS